MGLGAKSEKDWDFDGLGGSLGAKSKKDWDFDFWFFFFFFGEVGFGFKCLKCEREREREREIWLRVLFENYCLDTSHRFFARIVLS